MPKSTIDEMANDIANCTPQSARLLFDIIGERIVKAKKSSVLKATEICDKLFVQLEENDLILGNASKTIAQGDTKSE
jgi:hypothetical protein